MPPWLWPWISIGFTARPQSSTDAYRATSTRPVSGSTSTSQGDGTGIGVGWDAHRFVRHPHQRSAQIARDAVAECRGCDLEQADTAVGPLDDKTLLGKFDVLLRRRFAYERPGRPHIDPCSIDQLKPASGCKILERSHYSSCALPTRNSCRDERSFVQSVHRDISNPPSGPARNLGGRARLLWCSYRRKDPKQGRSGPGSYASCNSNSSRYAVIKDSKPVDLAS